MDNNKRPYPHFKFPQEIYISYKKLTPSECAWYGAKPNSYMLTCENYGWFPTYVLATVQQGKYVDGNNLGLTISGNSGSMSNCVVDIKRVIEMLEALEYNIVTKSEWAYIAQ